MLEVVEKSIELLLRHAEFKLGHIHIPEDVSITFRTFLLNDKNAFNEEYITSFRVYLAEQNEIRAMLADLTKYLLTESIKLIKDTRTTLNSRNPSVSSEDLFKIYSFWFLICNDCGLNARIRTVSSLYFDYMIAYSKQISSIARKIIERVEPDLSACRAEFQQTLSIENNEISKIQDQFIYFENCFWSNLKKYAKTLNCFWFTVSKSLPTFENRFILFDANKMKEEFYLKRKSV